MSAFTATRLGRRAAAPGASPVSPASAAAETTDLAVSVIPGEPVLARAGAASPAPTPVPEPPLMPRGRDEITLMTGTEWEARGTIFHSGVAGSRVMVLGGVHGNEPGGWIAAESIATWEVERGMLIVLPRLNWRAAAAFQRTFDEIGDLNRLYPGDPDGPPMARMAHEVTELVRYWRPHWLWDMHESWGFFNERGENTGSAFIGQTMTSTTEAAHSVLEPLVARVNTQIALREEMMARVRLGGTWGGRARSSLGMGTHVPGVNPVLVEMGQMDQPESRRAYLHELLLGELLHDLGMV